MLYGCLSGCVIQDLNLEFCDDCIFASASDASLDEIEGDGVKGSGKYS